MDNNERAVSTSTPNTSMLRKEVERYMSMYEREREQFEEFQRYSKELETEMELELKQRDRKIVELESAKRRMSAELENVKAKSEKDRRENFILEQELRSRVVNAEEMSTELRQKLRAVEQANDDLERRERIHAQQLHDLSERYDQCLERCAMLEAGMLTPSQQQQQQASQPNNSCDGVESMEVVGMDGLMATPPSSVRECAQLMANGRPSQRLIAQMLRKVEAAEAHLNSSSSSSASPNSFISLPTSTTATTNGHHHNSHNNNSFQHHNGGC